MRKFLQMKFCLLLLISVNTLAQDRVVNGRVTNAEDGSPIPGVNVIIKGTGSGTTTDADGRYSLQVSAAQAILVFSFIGFQSTELEVGQRSILDVVMTSDVTQLSEVVVTSLGIERDRKALSYSVGEVKGDALQMRAESDPLRALTGKVAGVNIVGQGGNIGSSTSVTVRGYSSLLGNNQALFVVDGVPFDNSTSPSAGFGTPQIASTRSFDLDPNNIESITVLKGAAAAALYGSRASNGVILVTTKSGRTKSSRKGLEIAVNTSYNISEVANLPDYQTRYTSGNNFKYVNNNNGTWGAPFDVTHPAWQNPVNSALLLGVDSETGYGVVAHPWSQYNVATGTPYFPEFATATTLLRPRDNARDFFRKGSLQETSISIASGNEKASFSATLSRAAEEGYIPENRNERYSGSVGGTVALSNKFTVSGNINYVRNQIEGPPISNAGIASATGLFQRILFTPPNIHLKDLPFEDANGNMAFYIPSQNNPYWLLKYAPYKETTNRTWGKINLSYDVLDWLNVSYQLGTNYYLTQKNEAISSTSASNPIGFIRYDDLQNTEVDGNFIVTATRDLTESIGLIARVGHNFNKRINQRQVFTGAGMVVRNIYDIDNFQTVLPGGGGLSERAYHAYFADLSFDYKDYLFLNLTGRNDLTSTLPKSSRSYFYGGISSSLIFTEAFNVSYPSWLNSGKLRVALARTGSDNSPYQTQLVNINTNLSVGGGAGGGIENTGTGFPFGNINGQTVTSALGNESLTPEFTTEFEIGTDLAFFNNKIKLDFTYYTRATTDQILPITLPSSTGYQSKVTNIGKVSNKGIEIGLDVTPLTLGSFSWNIYTTFTRNRNTVDKLALGLDEVIAGGYTGSPDIRHVAGLPYGQIYGSVAQRDDDGNLLIDPETGKLIITRVDRIGDPNPDFLLGFNNTFTYKGLSLNFLLDFRVGGDMLSYTYNQLYGRGVTKGTIPKGPNGRFITLVIPGVIGDPLTGEAVLDDSGNTMPNTTQLTVNDWYFINTFGSAGANEFSVFDATTVRLREVSLGYSLPKKLLSKTPFGSVSLSVIGRNLFFKSINFPGDLNFDAETNSVGAGNTQGLDFGASPSSKRYGVNLRVTF